MMLPDSQPEASEVASESIGLVEALLGRLDLLAILTLVLGLSALAVTGVVLMAIQVARLIASLCHHPIDRWLVVAFLFAMIWVGFRGRKICVF